MSLLKILPNAVDSSQDYTFGSVSASTITANGIQLSAPASIANVWVSDSSYNVLDDTAANTTGGYIVVSGTNFQSGSIVIVGTNNATSTTVVNTSIIRAQVPASASGTYPVYVVAPNGAVSIKVNGLSYSSFPAWGTAATLANTANATAFSVTLSANSDSSITYSNTTALPAGTTLLSNGYFYGTVTVASDTTYNFTVKATDAELQDASRTFNMTTVAISPLPTNVLFYMSGQGTNGAVPTAKVADGTVVTMSQYLGTPSVSTTQYKYGSSSIRVGSGQTLAYTLGSFALGSGDFTVEGWYRCDSALAERVFFGIGNYAAPTSPSGGFITMTDNSRKFLVGINGGYCNTDGFASGGDITAGSWTHLALVKSGTTWTTFVNGNAYQSTTNSGTVTSSILFIGRAAGSNWGNGDFYINDLRVSNVARYSGSYTPPGYFNY